MAKILYYNLNPPKAAKLKMLCRSLFIEAVEVGKDDCGKKIAAVLDGTAASQPPQPADVDGEMLYFSGMNGTMVSVLLNQLRRKKLSVALKAMQTETNVNFTSAELYRELIAERDAIAKGTTAHAE